MSKHLSKRQRCKRDPFNGPRPKVRAWKIKCGLLLPHKSETTKKIEKVRANAAPPRRSPFSALVR